jgi:hypothetical protein
VIRTVVGKVLDRTKFQRSDFEPHRVWVPKAGSGPARSIVYATERRRRLKGLVIITLAVIVGLAIWVVHAPNVVLLLPAIVVGFGANYALGGRSGFYEVAEDGGVGAYLGKRTADLNSMREMRVR